MQRCGGAGEDAERALSATTRRRCSIAPRRLRRSARSASSAASTIAAAAISTPTASRSASPAPRAGHGATIHENTPAVALAAGPIVKTPRGEIRAERVIVATDGRSGSFETDHPPAHGRHQQLCRRDRAARRGGRENHARRTVRRRQPLRRPLLAKDRRRAAGLRRRREQRRKHPGRRALLRPPASCWRSIRSSPGASSRTAGAASSRSRRRGFRSCARFFRTSGRRAAIPARAWRSRRSSASFWRRRRRARRIASSVFAEFPIPRFLSRPGCAARW